MRLFWGDGAASLLALFAFISGFGALNGWILIQGEMPRVLAKEKIFPAAVRARVALPHAGLLAVHHQRAGHGRHADELQRLDGQACSR